MPNATPTLDDLLSEANWLEWRSLCLPSLLPTTEMVTTDQTRAEFVYGARLLRLDRRPRLGGVCGPTPIQLVIADTLNAGKKLNGVLEPRRTTKTTSIEAVILGRCEHREDYQVGWTLATTGQKAAERFRKDIVVHVERVYPDPKSRPFTVNVGKGTEHIAWPNGSFFNVYAPGGDGFRSGGFDVAWVDEGGEAEPDLSEDLTLAVLPTMDTKPGAQFIVSGTAAKFRGGNLLFDTLNDPKAAVIQHGIPDTTDPEELESWEPTEDHPRGRVRELIELSHPGVGWTSDLEAIHDNYEKFPAEKFGAEYLGLFGSEGTATGIIKPAVWERTTEPGDPPGAPGRFALAIAIHPDGLYASVGVAWHLEEPGAEDLVETALELEGGPTEPQPEAVGVGLLWWQQGVSGFGKRVLQFAREHNVGIIYDQHSQAAGVEVETLSRAMPRPTLIPATTVDVRRGATKIIKGLEDGSVRHWRTPRLDTAAEIAVKRAIGTAGGFGFGRRKLHPDDDITPLEAVSLAYQFLGENREERDLSFDFGDDDDDTED
jgi:hypothetical protein